MINSKGEAALAAAVLVTLIEDIEAYEKTCDKKWHKKDEGRKSTIFRNMCDAIHCAFHKNDTLMLWLSLADIPISTFRDNILKTYPRACSASMAG